MTNLHKYDLLYHVLKKQLTESDIIMLDDASSKVSSNLMSDEEFGKLLKKIARI